MVVTTSRDSLVDFWCGIDLLANLRVLFQYEWHPSIKWTLFPYGLGSVFAGWHGSP